MWTENSSKRIFRGINLPSVIACETGVVKVLKMPGPDYIMDGISLDSTEVKDQEKVKHALEFANAGSPNLLML